MKALLFAVLLSIMQTAPPVPRQTSDSANQTTDKGERKAGKHQGPIAQTPPPKPLPEKTISEKAPPGNPASPNTQQPVRIAELPPVSVTRDWIDITAWIFSGLLVGVGIVGICAAYRTLKAVEGQALIMRHQTIQIARQARLQETALRQWVVIENWRAIPWIPESGTLSLHVQFDVINPTNFPLTLDSVSIMFNCHGSTEQGDKIGRKNLVPPSKSHPVMTSIRITEEQLLKWDDLKELVFFVNGSVEFEDVLKEVRNQPFNGMIACSKKEGVRFIPPYGSGLYITEKGYKNPN